MRTEKIIDHIKNRNWRKRGKWDFNVFMGELYSGENTHYYKKIGLPFQRSRTVWFPNGDYLDLQNDWNSTKEYFVKQYKNNNKEFIQEYGDSCYKHGEELVKKSKIIKEKFSKENNNQELCKQLFELTENIREYMPFLSSLHLVDEFLTEKFEEYLEDFSNKNNLTKEEFFDYKQALTVSFKKIFVIEEKESFFKLALKIKKEELGLESKETNKLLEEHHKKYSWMKSAYLEHEPSTVKDFKNKLKNLMKTDFEKEYEQIKKSEKELKEKKDKYMKNIEGHDLHFIAQRVQFFGFLRSYRVDVFFIAINNCWKLFIEIANRLKMPVLELTWLTSKEIKDSLEETIDYKELIKKRKEACLMVMIDNEEFFLTGKGIEKIQEVVNYQEEVPKDEVKGQIAYPGIVKGICKILHNASEMNKIKEGEILIISMTDPQFIPVMEKASAFVTDMGGILCHAAIVSREMKKPCVIGTKHATKVFKDGDLIEVDADKGIVRKLN